MSYISGMKKMFVISALLLFVTGYAQSGKSALAKVDSLSAVKAKIADNRKTGSMALANVAVKEKALADAKGFKAFRKADEKERDIKAAQFELDKANSDAAAVNDAYLKLVNDSFRIEKDLQRMRK